MLTYIDFAIVLPVFDSPNSSKIFKELTKGQNAAAAAAAEEGVGTSVSGNLDSDFEAWSRGKCLYVCSICLWETRNCNEFWKHSLGSHQLSIADYKSHHGDPCIERNTTECKSCFKILRHDPGSLENHVAKMHEMTLKEYFDSFVAVKKKPKFGKESLIDIFKCGHP